MTGLDNSRTKVIFDNDKFKLPIHIIGAGASGSYLALTLAKLGLQNISVHDFDTIESHNIANQLYGINDIGKLKVDALQEIILNNTGITIKTYNKKVTTASNLTGVIYIMTDTMASRKRIFKSLINNYNIKLVIEPRMGVDMSRIYTINPIKQNQVKQYLNTLYSDDDVLELSACGGTQSVITSSLYIASQSVRNMINWWNNIEVPTEMLISHEYNEIICN